MNLGRISALPRQAPAFNHLTGELVGNSIQKEVIRHANIEAFAGRPGITQGQPR